MQWTGCTSLLLGCICFFIISNKMADSQECMSCGLNADNSTLACNISATNLLPTCLSINISDVQKISSVSNHTECSRTVGDQVSFNVSIMPLLFCELVSSAFNMKFDDCAGISTALQKISIQGIYAKFCAGSNIICSGTSGTTTTTTTMSLRSTISPTPGLPTVPCSEDCTTTYAILFPGQSSSGASSQTSITSAAECESFCTNSPLCVSYQIDNDYVGQQIFFCWIQNSASFLTAPNNRQINAKINEYVKTITCTTSSISGLVPLPTTMSSSTKGLVPLPTKTKDRVNQAMANDATQNRTSPALIVGLVIGLVGGSILVIVIIIVIYWRNFRRDKSAPEEPVVASPEKPVVASPEKPVVASPEKPVVASPEKPVVASPEKPVVASPEQPVVASNADQMENIPAARELSYGDSSSHYAEIGESPTNVNNSVDHVVSEEVQSPRNVAELNNINQEVIYAKAQKKEDRSNTATNDGLAPNTNSEDSTAAGKDEFSCGDNRF